MDAPPFRKPQSGTEAAFSLVEVCLSIGIISTSLLSLLGLLPAGLGVLRDSMEQTVHAQIVQRVAAELVSSDLASIGGTNLAFDDDGQMVSGADAASMRYRVAIETADPSLPGLTRIEDIQTMKSHLRRVRIGISRSTVSNAQVTWYAIQVAER